MSKNLFLLFFLFLLISCSSPIQNTSPIETKITFSISEIDEHGLIGPPDGKRLVAYQFFIPAHRSMQKEILQIDSSIQFHSKKDNTIYLCIGEGATRETLLKLASLHYIEKIEPFYGE